MDQQLASDQNLPKVIINRLDSDSFNYITVIAQPGTLTAQGVTATVFYGSYPIAMVHTPGDDGERYQIIKMVNENVCFAFSSAQTQAYVAFLVEFGIISGDSVQLWVNGALGYETVAELVASHAGDDDYSSVEFLSEVAHAMHNAYPDITPTPGML